MQWYNKSFQENGELKVRQCFKKENIYNIYNSYSHFFILNKKEAMHSYNIDSILTYMYMEHIGLA